MGTADDLAFDAIQMGAQMLYFKMKNNSRAKAFRTMASEHQLEFWQKPADYHGEIESIDASEHLTETQKMSRPLSIKAKMASRFFGDSPFQTKLWAFSTNRSRGGWQTNCNIMEGRWKGHLMTAFDTLHYEVDGEGEYSSVFAHCTGKMPRAIITPTGMIARMKRADEGQMLNWGYHKMSFELHDFNKRYRVLSADDKLTMDFISQAMIEYLMDHRKETWHIELAPAGILISTVFTLAPKVVAQAMDFLAGFIDHIDKDLLEA